MTVASSFMQSILSYIESAHYLVVVLVIVLIYIIIREGLKHAAEKHGYISVAVTAVIFMTLLYLHLYLYGVLAFLVLILLAYFSIRGDMIKAAREEKKNIKIEGVREKVRQKATTKATKKAQRSRK